MNDLVMLFLVLWVLTALMWYNSCKDRQHDEEVQKYKEDQKRLRDE